MVNEVFRIFKNKDFINLKTLREELKAKLGFKRGTNKKHVLHLYAKQKNVSKDTLFVAIRQKTGGKIKQAVYIK